MTGTYSKSMAKTLNVAIHSKPMTLVPGGRCHYIGWWVFFLGGGGDITLVHEFFLLEKGASPYWFTVLFI